jgi:glyoxylase-like metal-dependent hydrolase (beta-lactamase superfamily II)
VFIPILIEAHNPGPMTGMGNHTYLLAGDGAATLIDAGVGHPLHLSAIAAFLHDARASLDQVCVTHAHPDHASGTPAIAAQHSTARFLKYPWPGEDANYQVPWSSLVDGQTLAVAGEPLVALHTPGHSPDHVAFWHQPSGTVFCGDLVVEGSSVMIHSSRGGDLGAYLAALERVLALGPSRLLPAHGPEITDPARVLRAYLEHRLMRERQVIDALAAGHVTVSAIAESIYDGLQPPLMAAARENVRAHLDKLKKEERAVEEDARWMLRHG